VQRTVAMVLGMDMGKVRGIPLLDGPDTILEQRKISLAVLTHFFLIIVCSVPDFAL
jgi:hypothetical protein